MIARNVRCSQVRSRFERAELAELRLLGDPEDAERQQAEEPGQEPVRRGREGAEQFSLGVDVGWLGRAKVEHQHRRGKGENAVAQRLDAADVAAGEGIVMHSSSGDHRNRRRARSTRLRRPSRARAPLGEQPARYARAAPPRPRRCAPR